MTGKTCYTLFKQNITFYFKCYLHHNCSVNLNWKNAQLSSSAKPLRNVPSSILWFVNFCFLPFLRRTSVQKSKKNWFCYVQKRIGKEEMLKKISQSILLWLNSWRARGASHHSTFKGSSPTIGHTLLALPAKWMSSPSRKWERGDSPSLHLIIFVFGVSQKN